MNQPTFYVATSAGLIIGGLLMYFVNQQFSVETPDERRLPWDACGADFWSIQPG